MAGIAVVQHLHPAGIGRKIAADGAASLGGEAQGKQAVVGRRGVLDGLQDSAGLDRHRVADLVDFDDAVHAVERQHDLAAVLVRHAAADQAGVSALGHDGDLLRGAELDHARDLIGRGRPHDGERGAEIIVAPVREIGMLARLVDDQALVADDAAQLFDKVAHSPTHHSLRIFPGFMMFLGSRARFSDRIVSSSIFER